MLCEVWTTEGAFRWRAQTQQPEVQLRAGLVTLIPRLVQILLISA
jgi:hypothetical protein